MNHQIQVNDWVVEYVVNLFLAKGYNMQSEEMQGLLTLQINDWKRFMVKSGLNADSFLADEVAFEFRCKKIEGGAGRLFEQFASFVNSRPKTLREKEYSDQVQSQSQTCDVCGAKGWLDVNHVRRDGEIRRVTRRCVCLSGMKYASLQQASPDEIRSAFEDDRRELWKVEQWLRERDIDTTTRESFQKTWRAWLDKQSGMFQTIEVVKAKPVAYQKPAGRLIVAAS
ncbi:hypothetical protein UFOVP142_48 [uncultured Caudovirales phage]|uniref:Uncharacterized protein n=1 Tax=uncultured Caudovirales phage TaxID=2100421 RepID=A0A6J7XL22_9CAUD|nr:hypothetical protein UFOVP142_48 [uncultured Caudovirales phage]